MKRLQDIAKARGNMSAADMYADGHLTPEQSRKMISTIIEKNQFLQKITIDKTKKLQKTFDIWSLASGILVRVNPGNKPTSAQREKLGIGSVKLDNKVVQLWASITQDTLEDNADNPKFETETFAEFDKAFSNDLQNLGMIGAKDDYDQEKFENLNKGWFTLAKENSQVTKLEHKKTSKMIDKLSAVVKASNEDVLTQSVILISQSDYLAYQQEIGGRSGGLSILLNSGANHILGVPLEVASFVPKGKFLMTPLKNLIMSVGLDIRRTRWYDVEESCLKYKFEVYNDYQLAVGKWAVLSEENDADSDGDGI
nr:phage capsid protein [uncultured Campylobacter sp.]